MNRRESQIKVSRSNQAQFSDGLEPMRKEKYIKTLKDSQERNSNDSAYCKDLEGEIKRVKESGSNSGIINQ